MKNGLRVVHHTEYLCFVWNGQMYKFKVLCFGVKNAPFTFKRLGQTLRKLFNLKGISIIIYRDDILILSETFEKCIKDATRPWARQHCML